MVLIRRFAVVLVLASAGAAATFPVRSNGTIGDQQQTCRCLPGDDCWPSPQLWSQLNDTVSGRLIATQPIAVVCHGAAFDQTACDLLKENWDLPETQYA
jgi:hypothetical protein